MPATMRLIIEYFGTYFGVPVAASYLVHTTNPQARKRLGWYTLGRDGDLARWDPLRTDQITEFIGAQFGGGCS